MEVANETLLLGNPPPDGVTVEKTEDVVQVVGMNPWVPFFVEGVSIPLLGIFGFFGNLVAIKVLSSSELEMMRSIRHLLKLLAGFDATFLLLTVTLFSPAAWSQFYLTYCKPWMTPYMLPCIQLTLTGSVWTTVAVSIERYLSVCRGYRSDRVHLFYTAPILFFSIFFNAPRVLEMYTGYVNVTQIDPVNGNISLVKVPAALPTKLRLDLGYRRDYVTIANTFFITLLPFATLIVLNSLIFKTITKATRRHNAISSNQRRDDSVAMMLILIVVIFIVCHSIRSVVNTYECVQFALYGDSYVWPTWIEYLVQCSHLALVINSSSNILIYCCKDEKFLNVVLMTIGLSGVASRRRNGRGRGRNGTDGASNGNGKNRLLQVPGKNGNAGSSSGSPSLSTAGRTMLTVCDTNGGSSTVLDSTINSSPKSRQHLGDSSGCVVTAKVTNGKVTSVTFHPPEATAGSNTCNGVTSKTSSIDSQDCPSEEGPPRETTNLIPNTPSPSQQPSPNDDLIQRPVPNSTSQGIGGSVCSMCGVNSGEDLSVDDSEEVGDNGPATPGDNLHGEDATCTTSTQTPLLQYQDPLQYSSTNPAVTAGTLEIV